MIPKYRVWDKKKKEWLIKECMNQIFIRPDGTLVWWGAFGFDDNASDIFEIDWFIGFLDKDGSEIYGKDIIRFKGYKWDDNGVLSNPMRTEVVKFENGCFFAPGMYEEDCYEIGWNEVEVIGNTKENPELLKE